MQMMSHLVLSPSFTTTPLNFEEDSLACTHHHISKGSFYLRRNQIPLGYFPALLESTLWLRVTERNTLQLEDQCFKYQSIVDTMSEVISKELGAQYGLRAIPCVCLI